MKKATAKGRKKTGEDPSSLVRYPGGVSKSASSHPRYPFVVRWPGPGGKRMVKWFTNDTEALGWAKEKSEEAGELGSAFGSISEEERAAVAAWRKFTGEQTDPKPPPLSEVVRKFREQWQAEQAARDGETVAAAVQGFLVVKKAQHGEKSRHFLTIRPRLERFVREMGERKIATVKAGELEDWILHLESESKPEVKRGRPPKGGPLSDQTKKHFRAVLHALFAWARTRGMVTSNPVAETARLRPAPKVAGILGPATVKEYLAQVDAHAPQLLAFCAVRVFAGLREAEAAKADWSMIDLAAQRIILPAEVTKTRKRRIVKIEPALAAFLKPIAKRSGSLVGKITQRGKKGVGQSNASVRACYLRKANDSMPEGFNPPANWMRHTFATMHVAHFRNPAETSLQLGHKGNPQLLFDRYEGETTPEDAADFWAIRPSRKGKPRNVVAMLAGKDKTTTKTGGPESGTRRRKDSAV